MSVSETDLVEQAVVDLTKTLYTNTWEVLDEIDVVENPRQAAALERVFRECERRLRDRDPEWLFDYQARIDL